MTNRNGDPNGSLFWFIQEERKKKKKNGKSFFICASARSIIITMQYLTFSGSSCSAIGRSLERRRRARRPPSGTALLRKRNVLRLSGSPGTYPTAALWSLNGSCLRLFRIIAPEVLSAALWAALRARSAHSATACTLRSLPHTL